MTAPALFLPPTAASAAAPRRRFLSRSLSLSLSESSLLLAARLLLLPAHASGTQHYQQTHTTNSFNWCICATRQQEYDAQTAKKANTMSLSTPHLLLLPRP
jgi:hypothetical protein